MKYITCYSCRGNECSLPSVNNSLCYNATECWKTTARIAEGYEEVTRGCTQSENKLKQCNPYTNSASVAYRYNTTCCSEDLCNGGDFPTLLSEYKNESSSSSFYINMTGIVFIGFVLVCVAVVFISRRKSQKMMSVPCYPDTDENTSIEKPNTIRTEMSMERIDDSASSGSGPGMTRLMEKNFAKHISLVKLIGKGKYGSVWQGIWKVENVAVKIFPTTDEASWNREKEIYSDIGLRHPNILMYLGSDVITRNAATEMWLITDYHERGSLYDYLNEKTLNHFQMCKILISILSGITHLHTEIYSAGPVLAQPAIAHRDIKSRNILMKSDSECVIADFGLAVTFHPKSNKTVIPVPWTDINCPPTPETKQNLRVGTKRYMAPEILDLSITSRFESFRKADIYALSLVLWEVSRRTVTNDKVEDYQPPFFDAVQPDPSFEEMKAVVCDKQLRPAIPSRWLDDRVLGRISKMMELCWHQNPNVRLSALRLLKNIKKLSESI